MRGSHVEQFFNQPSLPEDQG